MAFRRAPVKQGMVNGAFAGSAMVSQSIDLDVSINLTGECMVCLQMTPLVKLPQCTHMLCEECRQQTIKFSNQCPNKCPGEIADRPPSLVSTAPQRSMPKDNGRCDLVVEDVPLGVEARQGGAKTPFHINKNPAVECVRIKAPGNYTRMQVSTYAQPISETVGSLRDRPRQVADRLRTVVSTAPQHSLPKGNGLCDLVVEDVPLGKYPNLSAGLSTIEVCKNSDCPQQNQRKTNSVCGMTTFLDIGDNAQLFLCPMCCQERCIMELVFKRCHVQVLGVEARQGGAKTPFHINKKPAVECVCIKMPGNYTRMQVSTYAQPISETPAFSNRGSRGEHAGQIADRPPIRMPTAPKRSAPTHNAWWW